MYTNRDMKWWATSVGLGTLTVTFVFLVAWSWARLADACNTALGTLWVVPIFLFVVGFLAVLLMLGEHVSTEDPDDTNTI